MPLIDSIGDGQFASQRRQALRTAFVAALRDLGLCDRDDPLVQMVAKTVIEIASGGESNPEQIRRLALDRLTCFDAEEAARTALLREAISLAGADLGNIQRYDPGDSSLAITVQQGFKQEFLRTFERVSVGDTSACARAMRAKAPILVPDISLDDDFKEYRGVAQRAGFASVLSVPLITSCAQLIGVLSVHFAATRSREEIRMDILSNYASHAANDLAGIFQRSKSDRRW